MSDDEPAAIDHGWLADGGDDPIAIAAQYDDWVDTYESDVGSWSYDAPDVVAGLVRTHTPDAERVLDAGCGIGMSGRALRSAGFDGVLHGVDVSPASIAKAVASDRYDECGVADLQQPLDIADDSFDALMCVGVMTYVPDVLACWREFARVVRPGGVVVATQRDDIWADRDTQGAIDALVADGTCEALLVTEARPYLPGNDDFADEVGVRYVVLRPR